MYANRAEGTRLLDEIFATRTLAEWKQALAGIRGVWSPVQRGLELYDDPQVLANGYLADVVPSDGSTFQLVTNPVQFDERPPALERAPALGEHTDEVLRAVGYDNEELIEMKVADALL